MGNQFENPIGLAAGFDKNAIALNQWHRLGFGFCEVGTITPLAQPGNDKPRLFRYPQHQAIINRMGFNNDGAVAIAGRIKSARYSIPIGINLGKNKITPNERAVEDYVAAFQKLKGLGSYYVVNVSSPNTPGLRDLQSANFLGEIAQALFAVQSDASILVKISPDLAPEDVDAIVELVNSTNLAGLIATNTTLDRTAFQGSKSEEGGLSGAPLRTKSDEILTQIRRGLSHDKTLIGVGGIFSAEDAIRKFELGVDLVQLYTGWIYGGPQVIPQILTGILAEIETRGYKSLGDFKKN
jgi:dihydroorotate dehydrogenase